MEGKVCTTCGVVKALAEFYTDRRRRDNKYSECKTCTAARRKADRARARKAEARYRSKHREAIRQRDRAHYAANPAKRIRAATVSRRKRRERERSAEVA